MGDPPSPAATAAPRPRLTRVVLPLALLFLAAQLPRWFQPIGHSHAWRQADTAAVARNLVVESFDPCHPRIDLRRDTTGVTGMEFPLYQTGCAAVHLVAGTAVDWPGKVLSSLAGLAAFVLLGLILHRRYGLHPAAAWPAAFAPPVFFLFGAKYMPETTALALALLGWWSYDRFREQRRPGAAALAWLAYALAILARPFIAFLALPILADWLVDLRHRRWRDAVVTGVLGAAILVPFAIWYGWWAPHLTRSSGLDYFYTGRPVANNLRAMLALDPWRKLGYILGQDYSGWFLLPLVVLGWWRLGLGDPPAATRRPQLMTWALPAIVIVGIICVTGRHYHPHIYYLFALVPAVACAAAVALDWLWRRRPRLGLAVSLLVPLLTVAFHYREYRQPKQYAGYAAVLAEVAERVAVDDLVVVENHKNLYAFHLHPLRRRGWVEPAPWPATPLDIRDPATVVDLIRRGARWFIPWEDDAYRLYPAEEWLRRVADPAARDLRPPDGGHHEAP